MNTNKTVDIFVRDVRAGTTSRVSVSGTERQADLYSLDPGISADGRWVSFRSGATNLVRDDANARSDVFVRDRLRGTTTRVSVKSNNHPGNGHSDLSAIDSSGRWVVFGSRATNLAPGGDTNARSDVFVHDLRTGVTTRESVTADGAQANEESFAPAISADGRHVAFLSFADNLVPGDTNDRLDVFVRDRRWVTLTPPGPVWTDRSAAAAASTS